MTPRRRGGGAVRTGLATALLLLVAPLRSHAHGLDPALLILRESRPGLFDVTWKSSALRLPGADVRPHLPDHCREVTPRRLLDDPDRVSQRWQIDCGAQGLAGATLGIDDLALAKITALLLIEHRDGTTVERVLSGREPSYTMPNRPSRGDVLHTYAALGAAHIFSVPDYLLVVIGLLLLVSAPRQLLQTLLAFTLGHSITLAVATLHLSRPLPAIGGVIAFGLLLLAVELARDADRATALRRAPWLAGLLFGLLHGFGLAGALTDAGVPPADAPLALISFNGGLELGQLLFIGTALTAAALATRWRPAIATRATRPAVYAIGILAAYWCFERVAVWLG